LRGSDGNDEIRGLKGRDLAIPGEGDDVVSGGAGKGDTISFRDSKKSVGVNMETGRATGEGDDSFTSVEAVFGTDKADIMTGDAGGNSLYGGGGPDLLNGAGHTDYIRGQDGNDEITGSGGPDTLHGDKGNDDVDGNDGDDYLHGHDGWDRLDGGDGEDKCVWGERITSCEKGMGVLEAQPRLPAQLPSAPAVAKR
jgi:Ca2+-binding RTX toxin-like protein